MDSNDRYAKTNLNKSNCICNIMKEQILEKVYKQGKRCSSEEERRERYLASQLRYSSKSWTCDCGRTIRKGNKTNHLRSKIHIISLSQ
jgi:hypothetical protein